MKNNTYFAFGLNSLIDTINNNRKIIKIFITKERYGDLIKKIPKKIPIEIKEKSKIDKMNMHKFNTQGICAILEKGGKITLKEYLSNHKSKFSTIVMLNNISDQRNIGSIIRVATALNSEAVIINKKYFNETNSLMIKASSGTINSIQIIEVGNDHNSIQLLKDHNFWIYALDGQAKQDVKKVKWAEKSVIVVGSEGDGIQRIIKDASDEVIKINISKNVESLNVTSALSICLFQKKTTQE